MTQEQLKRVLANTGLFTFTEEQDIIRTCGTFTVGNAIIACDLLGIKLTGHDIDIMISTSK